MSVTQQNIPKIVNGDQLIAFMPSKQVKSISGYQDMPSMHSWYKDNPDKAHLGLMNLWGKQANQTYPSIYRELLKNRSVLEVNGFEGGFTYELPIEENKGCYTVRDMSHQIKPGIEGNTFEIVLNKQFSPGDTISNDPYRGQEVVVSQEEPIVPEGEGWRHTVKLVDQDKETYFLASNLRAGISYYKTGHGVFGEYGENASRVEMIDTVGSMKCEFRLGSKRLVEAAVTADAGSKNIGGAAASSKQYHSQLMAEADRLGDIMLMFDKNKKTGKADKNSMRIGTTMEFLVHRELEKLTAKSLMFQRAGTVRDGNGMARFNEGLYHQIRRGKLIKYARPGGITRGHLKEAVEYLFRNNPHKQDIERRIKFKCGKYAYQNLLEIFSDELNAQNTRLAPFKGDMSTIPNPVQGTDLLNLEFKPIRFTQVYIPNLGNIAIEEDTSFNEAPFQDRFSRGMHPQGLAHTAYSMIIWDVDDQQYSNNKDLPKGAELIENGNMDSNIYLVKPEGEHYFWGGEYGRFSSHRAGDIVSSSRQLSESYWAWNSVAIWVKDVTRFLTIELDDAGSKGFNSFGSTVNSGIKGV